MNRQGTKKFIEDQRKATRDMLLRREYSDDARHEALGRLRVLHQLVVIGMGNAVERLRLARDIEVDIGRIRHHGAGGVDVYVAPTDAGAWSVTVQKGYSTRASLDNGYTVVPYHESLGAFPDAYNYALKLAKRLQLGVWLYMPHSELKSLYVRAGEVGSYLRSYPTGAGAAYPLGEEPPKAVRA